MTMKVTEAMIDAAIERSYELRSGELTNYAAREILEAAMSAASPPDENNPFSRSDAGNDAGANAENGSNNV